MEELIKRLRNVGPQHEPSVLFRDAADALEAQQARIAELDSALDACLNGKRVPIAVANRTYDISALQELKAGYEAMIAELREALHAVSLCEFNSMSSRQEMGRLSRKALETEDDLSALATHDAELLNDEARNPWKRAIIDAAVVNWTYNKKHETDPHAAVNALLCMCSQMALDPLISKDAEELVAKAWKAALLEAADYADTKGGCGLLPFELRRMAEGEK